MVVMVGQNNQINVSSQTKVQVRILIKDMIQVWCTTYYDYSLCNNEKKYLQRKLGWSEFNDESLAYCLSTEA